MGRTKGAAKYLLISFFFLKFIGFFFFNLHIETVLDLNVTVKHLESISCTCTCTLLYFTLLYCNIFFPSAVETPFEPVNVPNSE